MPKTIVLLSDGTGNSSAKLFKTNVWRVYQALDLSEAGNVRAIYDDGVGTDTFAPLALLGGAIGWGLAQNVRELYAFLCRNYEPGDAIYAFGFSRGAFTIRSLVGLISSQGVVRTDSEDALQRHVGLAYRRHRKLFRTNWQLMWDALRAEPTPQMQPLGPVPPIEFLGLWDTVAAYGLPIDELQRGIDRYWHAHTFPDRDLSSIVKRACHALSLDDERRTFHPVLWNERGEAPGRIDQVWFAGAHSDVGGGYPNEALSYVPLTWIMRQAAKAGLRFKPNAISNFEGLADPHGELHDARKGLAAYYRYAPRRIETLSDDAYVHVQIARPKIHESVLQRTQQAREVYAPLGLPCDYDVVRSTDDSVVPLSELRDADGKALYESVDEARARAGAPHATPGEIERAWDQVWYRRLLYFVTLGLSLLLAAFPLLFKPARPFACSDALCFVSTAVFEPLAALMPAWAARWLNAFALRPNLSLITIGALVASLWLSSRLATRIRDRAQAAWRHLRGPSPQAARYQPGLIFGVRSSGLLVQPYLVLARSVIPAAFAAVLAACLWIALDRVSFAASSSIGLACPAIADDVNTQQFKIRNPCQRTGLIVERGKRYRVTLVPGVQEWHDGEIVLDDPLHGLTPEKLDALPWQTQLRLYLASTLRRSPTHPWLAPLAKVGSRGTDVYMLDGREFRARSDGELFLFVNDALGLIPFLWDAPYRDNEGEARIIVQAIPADSASPPETLAPLARANR